MHFDVLHDSRKILCFLINCNVSNSYINCGLAVFYGGISGQIEVTNGYKKFKIEIPEVVKNTVNWLTIVDSKDNYKIKVINDAS